MTSRIVKPYELDKPLDAGGQAATLKVNGPATLLRVVLGAKPVSSLIATASGDPQKHVMLVPVFMFECDPGQEECERSFLITPANKLITSENEYFIYRDSILYPDGKLFFIFEIIPYKETDKETKEEGNQ